MLQFNTVGYYNTLQGRLKQNENTLLNVLKRSTEKHALERMGAQGVPSEAQVPLADEETQSDNASLEVKNLPTDVIEI